MIAVWKIYWFDLFWSLYPVLYSIFTFVQYFYAYWRYIVTKEPVVKKTLVTHTGASRKSHTTAELPAINRDTQVGCHARVKTLSRQTT